MEGYVPIIHTYIHTWRNWSTGGMTMASIDTAAHGTRLQSTADSTQGDALPVPVQLVRVVLAGVGSPGERAAIRARGLKLLGISLARRL